MKQIKKNIMEAARAIIPMVVKKKKCSENKIYF